MKKGVQLAIVLCLLGAACGNEEANVAVTTTTTTQPVTTTTALRAPIALEGPVNLAGVKDYTGAGTYVGIEFTLGDLSFNPTFVKVLPGTTVAYRLDNRSSTEHTFTIDALDIDETVGANSVVEGELTLPEGTFNVAQATTTTQPDAAAQGIFEFYSKAFEDQGMRGAFYFQEGAAASAASSELERDAGGGGSGTGAASGGYRNGSGTGNRKATGSNYSSRGSQVTTNRSGGHPLDSINSNINDSFGEPKPKQKATTGTTLQVTKPTVTAAKPRSSQAPAPTGKSGESSPPGKSGTSGTAGDEGKEGDAGKDGKDVVDPLPPWLN